MILPPGYQAGSQRRYPVLYRAQGIAYEHQEFDDGHMDIDYRYDVSLPKLALALSVGDDQTAG